MNQYVLFIIGAFVISMLCGFVSIPLIINFCKKRKLYDQPNARKIHSNGIPRLGGICFLPSMILAFLIAMVAFNGTTGGNEITVSIWSVFFFISLLLIYAVGLIDDIVSLGPKTKFAAQIVAATLLPASGLYINNLYGFMGVYELPFYVGAPLTVLTIVFIDNAINLIDGIDGLAGGLSFIALAGFLNCFAREGIWTYCILITGLMGVLIAFLYFNIVGGKNNSMKIFMGDSGSLTLGFILGFLLVKFSMDNPNVMPFRRDGLMLSYTLVAIPILDVFRVILVRLRHRKPLFGADKNHIHHKLMRAGLTQRQALVVILAMALAYIAVNRLLFGVMYFSSVVVLDIALWLVFHAAINHFIRRNGQKVFFTDSNND